jgi:hypothetical protein
MQYKTLKKFFAPIWAEIGTPVLLLLSVGVIISLFTVPMVMLNRYEDSQIINYSKCKAIGETIAPGVKWIEELKICTIRKDEFSDTFYTFTIVNGKIVRQETTL